MRSYYRRFTAFFHGFQSPVDKFIYTKFCVDKRLIYTTGQGVDNHVMYVPSAPSVSLKSRADFSSFDSNMNNIRGQGQGLGSSYPDRGWVWVGVSSGEGYW